MRTILTGFAVLGLSACADAAPEAAPPSLSAECKAEGTDRFVGQTASPDTGSAILTATGARTLRWVAPGMAVTMDYRADRVTVSYDAAMKIERVNCG